MASSHYLFLSKHKSLKVFIHTFGINLHVYVNLLISHIQPYLGAFTILAVAVDVLRVAENVLSLYSSSATSPRHPLSNMVP